MAVFNLRLSDQRERRSRLTFAVVGELTFYRRSCIIPMMLEILVLVLSLVGLAKRKPSRRRFNLRRVHTTPEITLATLATDTALSVATVGASTSTYRAMSLKGTWSLSGLTAGEGPITVGFAHSDYTVTEIKEWMESFGAIDPTDMVERERANRLIRIVGTFPPSANSVLNNGNPIRTKLNWLIGIGAQVNVFAFNEDTAANLTTGAVVNFTGDYWVKDSA